MGQQILNRRKQVPPKSQAETTSPKRIVIWPKQTAKPISGNAVSDEVADEATETAAYETIATTEAQETIPENALFIASTLRKRFHTPDCRWAAQIAEENRVYLVSREHAVQQGYAPCGTCRPGA